jgi:hypothetical protein
MEWKWANAGEVFPTFSAEVAGNTIVDSSEANEHGIVGFGEITGTGKTLSSMLCLRITRDGSADDYSGAAHLLEVDVHYQRDSDGSKQEYIK